MKTLKLTKRQCVALRAQLESKNDGYTLGDLRKIHKFLDVIDALAADYDQALKELVSLYGQNGELQPAVDRLDEGLGSEEVEVQVEDAQFRCVEDSFRSFTSWRGTRSIRELVLSLEDAFEKALTTN